MVYKVKMKKEDYFKINNKIISSNLTIAGDDVTFELEGGSYNILKRTNYEYKLIDSSKTKIIRFLSRYGLLITGILFLLSVLYMNIYRVKKIEFNRETPINGAIEFRLKSSFKTLFCFKFCSMDYKDFSKKMRQKYFEYPYIDVSCKNNVISVYIANVDEISYEYNEAHVGTIVAKKDAIVDTFYVYSGKIQVAKNKYVKMGAPLISGEKVSGLVLGTTYDKMVISVPKSESVYQLSDELDEYVNLKLFNLNFNFNKKKNFDLSESKEAIIFNLFDFLTIKKIAETKKDAIIRKYSKDEAKALAIAKIENDFKIHSTSEYEHIIAVTNTKEVEEEDSYIYTFIVKKYESLGTLSA